MSSASFAPESRPKLEIKPSVLTISVPITVLVIMNGFGGEQSKGSVAKRGDEDGWFNFKNPKQLQDRKKEGVKTQMAG